MNTKKLSRPPGRPRNFDPDQAVAIAQRLFHTQGYDAVSVANVTEALGINPPSFYAAFDNKAGLYARVLDRYACTDAIPLKDLLRSDRPVADCLASVLEDAARRYGADPETAGCLVLEGTHAEDPQARAAACRFHAAAEEMIRAYIAERRPEKAGRLTDFVSLVMQGLSAKSRQGYTVDRLMDAARLASQALADELRCGTDGSAR
ncbi:TetR/AcrR family transcriptional regulator [Castellaniella sp.]|uniref:TetR/AcrR family transcriptional regulator n=1 Tax=Castellaniella sp. TaxID=1955812 RepID=UPI003C79158D